MELVVWYAGKPDERKLRAFLGRSRKTVKVNAVVPLITVGAQTDIAAQIWEASEPIKQLLIGLADPVCYIVFSWGLLECMLGKGSTGVTRMKYATLGYLGMNWLPTFMEVLRGAKPSV